MCFDDTPPGPTSQTVTNTTIPDYAKPYVESMLGKGFGTVNPDTGVMEGGVFNQPYQAYTGERQAGFSDLQNQAQTGAANLALPGTFGRAEDLASRAGIGALGTVGQAAGYGAQGAAYGSQGASYGSQGQQSGLTGQQLGTAGGGFYGAQGAEYGTQGQQAGLRGEQIGQQGQQIGTAGGGFYGAQGAAAGNAYGQNATNPDAVAAFMNPYLQATLNPALQLQAQQFGQQNAAIQGQATQAGAFGGGRQAVLQGLNQQNQALAQNQLVSGAYNQAFNTANQNMQTAGSQAMQGAQIGLQGANTALAGNAQGLQGAGLGIQGSQAGMQGSQVGLQGVNAALAGTAQGMQGAGLGIQGTAQGLQGAQVGLQGVGAQQAGFNQAGSQAANLANIGNQGLGAQQGILNTQAGFGATQQAQNQAGLTQQYNDFLAQRNYQRTQLADQSNILRGVPLSGSQSSDTFAAAPSSLNQLVGAGTAAFGASRLAKGGKTKEKKRPAGLAALALMKMQ